MREHPIPQDITGYRFHLIGNMTLKQFAMILLGTIVAFVFYKTNLPDFIKWPLSITFFALGFAAAFVPIEERPLDHWIITFIKTLYKPTKFYWQKKPKVPDAFQHKTGEQDTTPTTEIDTSHIKRDKIQQFLKSVEPTTDNKDEFDLTQDQRVNQILQNFQQVQVEQNPVRKATKPNLQVRARKIKPAPTDAVVFSAPPVAKQESTLSQNIQLANTSEALKPSPKKNNPQTDQGPNESIKTASQNQDLPFPSKPTHPNRLVGMVVTPNKELVGGALIEVQNAQGQTITAVKSNSLGQFNISQQLSNGEYLLNIKKDGLEFDSQKIELSGKIIDPIEISSKV